MAAKMAEEVLRHNSHNSVRVQNHWLRERGLFVTLGAIFEDELVDERFDTPLLPKWALDPTYGLD